VIDCGQMPSESRREHAKGLDGQGSAEDRRRGKGLSKRPSKETQAKKNMAQTGISRLKQGNSRHTREKGGKSSLTNEGANQFLLNRAFDTIKLKKPN